MKKDALKVAMDAPPLITSVIDAAIGAASISPSCVCLAATL
jgi:hypothetical protein